LRELWCRHSGFPDQLWSGSADNPLRNQGRREHRFHSSAQYRSEGEAGTLVSGPRTRLA